MVMELAWNDFADIYYQNDRTHEISIAVVSRIMDIDCSPVRVFPEGNDVDD